MTAVATAALLTVAGCGGSDGDAARAPSGERRVVEITMADISFTPSTVRVERGETVTFRFRNTGKVAHDAYLGDAEAQAEHEREMRDAMGGMHHGEDAEAITVEPGETGSLTHTFRERGSLEIGCHQPGHYAAGMKIDVTVD